MDECTPETSTPDFSTPDEPFPPFFTAETMANVFQPQFSPLTLTSIPDDIASDTPPVRSEATIGAYNPANVRTINNAFKPGLRAQRFTDYINRIGQEVEWFRAVPHIETKVPVGQNQYTDPDTGYSLRNENFNPPEELVFAQYSQILQLKGYLSPIGETTVFQEGITEVDSASFRIQSADFSTTYQLNADYTLNAACGEVTITVNSSIPLGTIVKASYLISEPCIDPYTKSARPECPIDSGEGFVYHNGQGIMDRDGKTMLFGLHSDLSNSRDQSSTSLTRASGGTSFIPIFRPPAQMTSGFETMVPQFSVQPEGPGMAEVGNDTARFSQYDRPDRAMLMLENSESNLMLDSSFEVDPLGNTLSLWAASNVSATTDNTYFLHGNQAALLDTTSSMTLNQAGILTQQKTLPPGTYLLYAYVRIPGDSSIMMNYPIYNQQSSFAAGAFPVSLYASASLLDNPLRTMATPMPWGEAGWFRLQTVITVPSSGNATLNVGFFVQPFNKVWVDCVQLQMTNVYPTSYIPTTFSPLTRLPDQLAPINFLGNISPAQGGISMRVRPNWRGCDLISGDRRWLFRWGEDPQRIWLYYENGTLVLSIGALDENGSPKTVDVTLPWSPQYERVYKISALWDNTQGNYLAIDDQWIENTLTPTGWNPSDYSATFTLGSDGTNNFDGWISDVVGWGLLIHPQEAIALYYSDDSMTFNTGTRINVIVEVPKFKSEFTKIGFFQEGDVFIAFPANYRITADNMGSFENNKNSHLTFVRHKIKILGQDFRVLNPPELIFAENEVVGKRAHLRLIQTSDENSL